jgi:hypothetical protein
MKVKPGSGESLVSEDGNVKTHKDGYTATTKYPVTKSYQEQFNRLGRIHRRLERMVEGRAHDMESDDYKDEIYIFFLICHHVKDWLIKDEAFPASDKEVEDYINSNKELQICADICNGHKHFRLDRKPRSTEQPSVGGHTFEVKLGRNVEIKITFIIDTVSGPMDGFELATKCVDLWKTFIVKNGGTI